MKHTLIKKALFSFPSSVILMLHHVGIPHDQMLSSCGISYSNFALIMDALKNRAGTLTDAIQKNSVVAVSFDDGFEEVYTLCYPLLKEMGIPFTAFIVEDFVGYKGYMSQEQLMRMASDPLVTIGSHGKSHQILPKLTKSAVTDEILGSKKSLESILNVPIDLFAYSHGQRDAKCFPAITEYRYAFSANSLPLNAITRIDKYYLPRLNTTDATVHVVLSMIEGKSCK